MFCSIPRRIAFQSNLTSGYWVQEITETRHAALFAPPEHLERLGLGVKREQDSLLDLSGFQLLRGGNQLAIVEAMPLYNMAIANESRSFYDPAWLPGTCVIRNRD
jgi:hypothetical protein